MHKHALITVIEGNYNCINFKNDNTPRLLEDEAIKCFKSWRKYGGKLKDIDAYCICISGNTPTEETIKQLSILNVKYIEHYMPETKSFNNGWWNKPLGCSILEKQLVPYDFFIHIDLDMYLCKEICFDINHNMCLTYDINDAKDERACTSIFPKNFKPFNTCFIVFKRIDFLFTKWYDCLRQLEYSFINDTHMYKKFFIDIEYEKLEEGAMDILSITNNIMQLKDIMFGETYTPLCAMHNIKNVCFHHYHIYKKYNLSKYNFIKEKIYFTSYANS